MPTRSARTAEAGGRTPEALEVSADVSLGSGPNGGFTLTCVEITVDAALDS